MNQIISPPLPGTLIDPRHPDEDGRFMGETDFHTAALIWLREGLKDHFSDSDNVYVGSNLIYYWVEGNADARRDPDGLVAKGVYGSHARRSYRLWEEKKKPCTFFEIVSRRTWRVDLREKPPLYAQLGIKEYFLFDPETKYIDPVLQGFRNIKGEARPMKPARDGSLVSKELGLRLVPEGPMLRMVNLATGQPILTRDEKAEQERQRADHESQRANVLAAEVERLRRLLGELQS
jgi:Uma2 family endonuclease